ncbi:hypothetical protein G9A89_009221 [Geosiphon pyriformis]|nr:hypothetical protein G9A89_009221 [Geosiphon pyriformis]
MPSPLKVLIIDDNDINLQILSRILSKHFSHLIQTTFTSTSGILALDILSKNEFDLIFCDIEMPMLNGVETTIEIRRGNNGENGYKILERNRNVPIIAVTTKDKECDRKEYAKAGMDACVGKPICLDELKTAIELVTGGIVDVENRGDFLSD